MIRVTSLQKKNVVKRVNQTDNWGQRRRRVKVSLLLENIRCYDFGSNILKMFIGYKCFFHIYSSWCIHLLQVNFIQQHAHYLQKEHLCLNLAHTLGCKRQLSQNTRKVITTQKSILILSKQHKCFLWWSKDPVCAFNQLFCLLFYKKLCLVGGTFESVLGIQYQRKPCR